MTDDATRATPKPPPVDRMSLLWQRVNEHKIVQWSVAYVALAYGIQHAVILTSESFEWPGTVARATMLLFVLGLPVIMLLAWYHGHHASRHVSKVEFSIIALLLAIGSLWFYVFVNPHEETAASTPATQEAGVVQARRAAADPHGAISVAVLPFVNLSSDPEQEFFSDGMTEEITSTLARVPDLRVVGRTSAFQFKGENKDLRAIGQSLAATHVIEGSVRKVGTRVRVTVQLVKADDGIGLWTDNYDRQLTDVFAIQESIAQAIAAALRVPLGLKEAKALVRNRTSDAASYDDYLRAKALFRARGVDRLTQAANLLEQVVSRNPDFAPGWALLAQSYDKLPTYHPSYASGAVEEARRVVDASLPRAETAARRAVELDPDIVDGYVALGLVERDRGKLVLAESTFQQALALDPDNPETLHFYGEMLGEVGRLKEALAMRQHLQALEPFVPVFNFSTALALGEAGQDSAAIALMKDLSPHYGFGYAYLPIFYAAAGRYSEAADALSSVPAGIFPPGVVEDAARLLRTVPKPATSSKNLPRLGYLGYVYLHIGAIERVLDLFEDGAEVGYHVPSNTALLWHASYAPVRKLERFKAFARKAGLVEYWRAKGWPPQCHPATGDDFVCE